MNKRKLIISVLLILSITTIYTYNERNNRESKPVITDFIKVDDYPLYIGKYVGDYRFDEYLKTGQRQSLSGDGCTCFFHDYLFGRNFDFPANPVLLLWTTPDDGYRSVSMVDLGYFNYSLRNLPVGPVGLQDTPYLPFDGMNEKGLVVGMAAINEAEAPFELGRVSIGEIQVIRLLLDYAASVDEALELIKMYNVEIMFPPIHYLVSDAFGDSAIIEFVDGEMKAYNKTEFHQIITNFIITGKELPAEADCDRYRCVYDGLYSRSTISTDIAFSLLNEAHTSTTIWSVVYDVDSLRVYVAMGGDYSEIYSFELIEDDDR